MPRPRAKPNNFRSNSRSSGGRFRGTAALREQMIAEHQQAMADLAQKRQAVQRRADHVDHCRAALKQLRAELGRMHRETLEIRLATEEIWVQLSGARRRPRLPNRSAASAPSWPSSIARPVRSWPSRDKELETIRSQLAQQHEALVEQKRRFEQWAAGRQEECQQQASRLVAREQQLHRAGGSTSRAIAAWQVERMKYQQELRRLRAKLAAHEEAAVPA